MKSNSKCGKYFLKQLIYEIDPIHRYPKMNLPLILVSFLECLPANVFWFAVTRENDLEHEESEDNEGDNVEANIGIVVS